MALTINPAMELARLRAFALLPPKVLESLADATHVRRFKKGERLFREGQSPEVVNIVILGAVKLVKQTSEGRDVILEMYHAPAVVQEEAVFQDHPYGEDGVGLDDGIVLQLRRATFIRILREHPDSLWEFTLAFASRCRSCSMREGQEAGPGPVDYRIARLILRLVEQEGVREGANVSVYIPLTRQDIADIVGTTVETAIRVMSAWKRDQIVDTERGRITVTDMGGLRKIAKLT